MGKSAYGTWSFYSRHCSSTASGESCYGQSAETATQREIIDRSEREGRVAEELFRATLDDASSGGRWWLGVRIESGVKYVSAQSSERNVE
jgi:hypothetical protein